MPLYVPQPQLVTALPSTTGLADGYTVDYLADDTNGVVWRLRYRAASASTSKWEFVGGRPMTATVATQEALGTNNGTFVDVTTVGPQITAPLAGDYLVSFSASMLNNTAGAVIQCGVKPGAGAVAFPAKAYQAANINLFLTIGRSEQRINGVAAASAMKLQYAGSAGATQAADRMLALWPVRVG